MRNINIEIKIAFQFLLYLSFAESFKGCFDQHVQNFQFKSEAKQS